MENELPVPLFREEQSPSKGTPIGYEYFQTFYFLFLGFPIAIMCLCIGIGYTLAERNAGGTLGVLAGLLLLRGAIVASKASRELWNAKVTVELCSIGVTIQYRLKHSETLAIPRSEIDGCAYGELPLGYANGATVGPQGRAFSINSGEGVWIKLKSGENIFVGSMRPLELMDAIDKIKLK